MSNLLQAANESAKIEVITKVITEKTPEQIRKEIKNLRDLLPAAPLPTERTLVRREKNKAAMVKLNTFAMLVKELRQDLELPNRVKIDHISGNEVQIKEFLLKYCNENLHEKSQNHWYFNRAALLLTDINGLKKVGLTKSQFNTLNDKVWRYTNIVDAIVKGLTMTESVYLKALEVK